MLLLFFSYTNSAKLRFEITESLRAGNLELGLQQFGAVKEQYTKTIDALNEFVLENEYNSLHKRRREEVQK